MYLKIFPKIYFSKNTSSLLDKKVFRKKNRIETLFYKTCYHLLVLFGIGYFPKIPGTFSSLFAILSWRVMSFFCSDKTISLISLVYILLGFFICYIMRCEDYNCIVLDEFSGMFLITSSFEEPNIKKIVESFFAFRVLDIIKPFPINLLEKKIKDGVGIMMDDLLIALSIILYFR
ncbi:phosphatidylglycerophosphatase A [Candidatus Riesia pediculischaeffi]|nr:phosphatidylglycerophosphatase A [Candidatus Riesia pediculischaeffi]